MNIASSWFNKKRLLEKVRHFHNHRKNNDGKIVGEEKLLKNIGRLRDVKMGNDGFIYFTVEDPGLVLRIVPVE